jgi:CheY-specific phosphatase CheX
MKLTNIAPFIDAAVKVCEEVSAKPAVKGDLSVTQNLVTSCPVNIISVVSGDINGVAMIGIPREAALKLAELVLKKSLRVFDQMVSGAILDLGQQVFDQSSKTLNGLGINFVLTPTALIRGTSISVPTNDQPIIVVPLHFEDIGTIYLNLSVEETQAAQAA